MSGTSIDDRPLKKARSIQGGFTVNELMIVMVIVGILAAFALPKLTAALGMRDEAWHDELQAALRYAQKSAVSRRRLTCVTVNATTVAITTATVNPATSCGTTMPGLDGSATFATAANSAAATSVSPAGVIYFQPDGRATSDGAGTTSSSRTITIYNASSITVLGETGYVQ